MRRTIAVALLLSPLVLLAADRAPTPLVPRRIDLMELVGELQKQSPNQKVVDLVWWLPVEYWRATLDADAGASGVDPAEIEKVVAPYTMVAASFGAVAPFGGVTWMSADDLRASIVLVDAGGGEHAPLPADRVSDDARALVAVFRPTLANLIGPMGENMQIFFFPAAGSDGRRLADPAAAGGFSIVIEEERYDWRLPLDSVLPPKRCPVDGRLMKASWTYCPWHGRELLSSR